MQQPCPSSQRSGVVAGLWRRLGGDEEKLLSKYEVRISIRFTGATTIKSFKARSIVCNTNLTVRLAASTTIVSEVRGFHPTLNHAIQNFVRTSHYLLLQLWRRVFKYHWILVEQGAAMASFSEISSMLFSMAKNQYLSDNTRQKALSWIAPTSPLIKCPQYSSLPYYGSKEPISA